VNNRHQTEEHDLLRQTIADMAESLAVEDIRLADYLKLVQLRDELENDGFAPITAGWTSKCQSERKNRDG